MLIKGQLLTKIGGKWWYKLFIPFSVCWCLRQLQWSKFCTGIRNKCYWGEKLEHQGKFSTILVVKNISSFLPSFLPMLQIMQYSCGYDNLAPTGCTQYHFGNSIGTVMTFNYMEGTHLADQNQNICIRYVTMCMYVCMYVCMFVCNALHRVIDRQWGMQRLINLEISVLVRSLKSSDVELG